ncbi:unnamed protein product, partial [Linum tenue]
MVSSAYKRPDASNFSGEIQEQQRGKLYNSSSTSRKTMYIKTRVFAKYMTSWIQEIFRKAPKLSRIRTFDGHCHWFLSIQTSRCF